MGTVQAKNTELDRRAHELYERIRPAVETPENIGKLIIMDIDNSEYVIDELGIEASRLLQARHPGATLYALRIGYKTVVSFGGVLELLPK